MRRFLRFSLRTLLILVLFVGSVVTAWWHWAPWIKVSTTQNADPFDNEHFRRQKADLTFETVNLEEFVRVEISGRVLGTIKVEPPLRAQDFLYASTSPSGRYLVVHLHPKGDTSHLAVWDMAASPRRWVTGGKPAQINFSQDEHYIAVTFNETVEIGDLRAGKMNIATVHTGNLVNIAGAVFSPDNERIVVSQWDRYGSIWDWRRDQCLATLPNNDMTYSYAAFPTDDQILILDDVSSLHDWRRLHAESPVGLLALPELWLCALLFPLLLWSLRRDWRKTP